MTEKIPGLRIVGNASEEEKERVKAKIEQRLTDHINSLPERVQKEIKRLEYPKTEAEFTLIDFANAETNRLREEAGMDPYIIPADNYHIVPPEVYKEASQSDNDIGTALCDSDMQGIVFDARAYRDNPVYFGAAALHETLHLKGHLAIEVGTIGSKTKETDYRIGVSVFAAQKRRFDGGYHMHFKGLHEGIVARQEKLSMRNLFELPLLKKERERLNSEESNELIHKISEEKGIPEDDFIWVGNKADEFEIISYRTQREVVEYVCEEIQKQFPDKYHSTEEAFKEFLKAQFTGQLLTIARLVEGTFGEGSFRRLGDMKTDRESGITTLEALKKMRVKIKSNSISNTPQRRRE